MSRRLAPGWRARLLIVCALALVVVGVNAPAAAATTFINWPGYLYGSQHSSSSPATAITPANAAGLRRVWRWRCPSPEATEPADGFVASPTVYDGIIYIGCNTGVFYALSESTTEVLWSRSLGSVTRKTCAARGISSTATVTLNPSTGRLVAYVAGGDGYLYALDAASGAVVWRSVIAIPSATANDYYDWSSPAIANGLVYVGVASQCDEPLVSGAGLRAYNLTTGNLVQSYRSMPGVALGGSIWSSPAVDSSGAVFVTTGNKPPWTAPLGNSSSIVRLDGGTLTQTGAWMVPVAQQVGDNDWATSPTVFQANIGGVATEMVTACNKNGYLYAFAASSITTGPVWSFQVGAGTSNGVLSCLGASIWNGAALFVPGNATTINGTVYAGSMRELTPGGQPVWQTGLAGIILGSPSMDAAGVIAASTLGPGTINGTYLINAATGAILRFITLGKQFAQPVFADGYLILATGGGSIFGYAP